MSPRLRVWLVVTAAALAAAGVTVGVTQLTATHPRSVDTGTTLRPGAPPLILDLGVRTDPEAVALRRAEGLYDDGKRKQAGVVFRRYRSLEARVGAAFADWPDGFAYLRALAALHRRSALLQLHLGLGLYWTGADAAARAAWRSAKRLQPDSLYAVRAGDLLHPTQPVPGLPQFVPDFDPPAVVATLSPPKQLAYLAAHAGGVRGRLLYGVALQRLARPVSAEREFAAAAKLAPDDPQALTAAAVGLYDKDDPSRAFSRLGPLAKAYPKAATVRFHLGLCLVWLGQVRSAKREFALAATLGGRSIVGQQARAFLDRLSKVGGG